MSVGVQFQSFARNTRSEMQPLSASNSATDNRNRWASAQLTVIASNVAQQLIKGPVKSEMQLVSTGSTTDNSNRL